MLTVLKEGCNCGKILTLPGRFHRENQQSLSKGYLKQLSRGHLFKVIQLFEILTFKQKITTSSSKRTVKLLKVLTPSRPNNFWATSTILPKETERKKGVTVPRMVTVSTMSQSESTWGVSRYDWSGYIIN